MSQHRSDDERQKAANEKHDGPGPSNASTHVDPHQSPSKDYPSQRNTAEDDARKIEEIMARVLANFAEKPLEFLTLVGLGGTLVFVGMQSYTTKGQLEEMKKSRASEERAWVFVTIPDNALTVSSNSVCVIARSKNIGKTPALITRIYGNGWENFTDIPPRDPPGAKCGLVMIPNQECNVIINIPLNVAERIKNNAKVYVYGTIYYSDISGIEHWSQFCFSLTNYGILMHPENFHNSCDDFEAQ